MNKTRIIPAIDLIDGKCVRLEKGNYEKKKVYHADPLEVAKNFEAHGIQYLHLVDLDGAKAGKLVNHPIIEQICSKTNLSVDIGGGIKSAEDVKIAFESGAKQINIGSMAVKNPNLFKNWIANYGSERLILSADVSNGMDINQIGDNWYVFTRGGRTATDKKAIAWAKEVEDRGAGEILLTSMIGDGTQAGFSLEITAQISESLQIPVIASGGAGDKVHFKEAFITGKADAALAASVFHFGTIPIPELKKYLSKEGIPMRI
ncbi:UNVERIFIED_CONTAM: hypothetical protein GTU68_057043 [Idotea baltica]|nr:hypothetical protein [Idotea baltica]